MSPPPAVLIELKVSKSIRQHCCGPSMNKAL